MKTLKSKPKANRLKVHFSSATDDWATPQDTFDYLDTLYGPFTVDVCADEKNRKCFAWFGKKGKEFTDGLTVPWNIDHGGYKTTKCWMNPPYGREIGKWIHKAWEESKNGCSVCCLLPARTDTRWFHDYIYNRPNVEVTFLRGRLKFGGCKNSAPFPSMVVVFNLQR